MPNTEAMEQTDEKLRKRKARKKLNCESAKRSRENKKKYLAELEAKVVRLLQDIQELEELYDRQKTSMHLCRPSRLPTAHFSRVL